MVAMSPLGWMILWVLGPAAVAIVVTMIVWAVASVAEFVSRPWRKAPR